MISNKEKIFPFHYVLKIIRLERGLTLEKLAELTGLSENYIGRLERGISSPTFEKFIYICNGLEIKMTDFALKMKNVSYNCIPNKYIKDLHNVVIVNKKILCQSLIDIRRDKGISQIQLAEMSHINKTYYGFIERGQSNPTLNKIIKLCEGLNIDFFDFLLYIEKQRILYIKY